MRKIARHYDEIERMRNQLNTKIEQVE